MDFMKKALEQQEARAKQETLAVLRELQRDELEERAVEGSGRAGEVSSLHVDDVRSNALMSCAQRW